MAEEEWITLPDGRRVPIRPKKGSRRVAVASVVLVVSAVVGSGGVGIAVSTGGPSAVRVKSGKDAARKGHGEEAWRRMGFRSLKREVEQDLDCVAHSFGQVRELFIHEPCRSLQRELRGFIDPYGNTIVVSITWVRMLTPDRHPRSLNVKRQPARRDETMRSLRRSRSGS
jgi:hypothetical protein